MGGTAVHLFVNDFVNDPDNTLIMNGFIDLPVGTEFGYGGKRYVVAKAPVPGRCDGCAESPAHLDEEDIDNLCTIIACSSIARYDNIEIIITEKEEADE